MQWCSISAIFLLPIADCSSLSFHIVTVQSQRQHHCPRWWQCSSSYFHYTTQFCSVKNNGLFVPSKAYTSSLSDILVDFNQIKCVICKATCLKRGICGQWPACLTWVLEGAEWIVMRMQTMGKLDEGVSQISVFSLQLPGYMIFADHHWGERTCCSSLKYSAVWHVYDVPHSLCSVLAVCCITRRSPVLLPPPKSCRKTFTTRLISAALPLDVILVSASTAYS